MLEKDIENRIREMYKSRRWEGQVTDVIIEFVINFQKTYGDKYIDRVLNRLEELKEIKKEYNNSKYYASSKREYIVFFKEIKDTLKFKYILEHELFHFIQNEDSIFEKMPSIYQGIVNSNINILLLEEAFVQYFTACINQKEPEYKTKNNKKYWLNECYKDIVGYIEELEDKIGRQNLLDMYMDDKAYKKGIIEFDNKYGENEFLKCIEKICM